MKTIRIGDKQIGNLIADNMLDICIIENIYASFDFWNKPVIINFNNKLFSDKLVLYYNQTRKLDGILSKTIISFFNIRNFSIYWHFENFEHEARKSKNIGFETIKYLINNGFDIPIY